MRTVFLVSAILLLLTAPFWGSLLAGLLAGLWHQRVYVGVVRRRGIWMLCQWPFLQGARGIRWVYDWCPPICGALLVVVFIGGTFLLSALLSWLLAVPASVGHTRFATGVVAIPGAGHIEWYLGDTEAVIRTTIQDALQCSSDQRSLYGSGSIALLSRGAVLQLPTDTFLAGVYCGVLSTPPAQSVGIRVGPAP
jgi:hypothetical protein